MRYFAPITMIAFLGTLFIAGQALGVENGAVQSPAFEGRGGQAEQTPPHGQTPPYDTMGRDGMQQEQVSLEQLDSEQVRQLQQALQEQGVDPGPIDGIVGQETRDAIREFQQEEGIAATGQLDRETLEALDLDAQEFMGVSPAFGQTQPRQDRDLDERLGLDDQQRDERVGVQPRDDQQRIGAQERISAEQLTSSQVRELQQALQEHGADPGPIDGIMGPMTREGIREFQQDEGIAATGELDRETLEALDLDVQEFMGVAPPFEQERRDGIQPRDDMRQQRDGIQPRDDMRQQRNGVGMQPGDQQRDQQIGVQPRDDQLTSSQVRELQQALQEHGADPGPIDGIMGPMTREGIREFQQEEGIAATGQLDRETLEALDLDAQEFLGVAPAFEDGEQRMEMEREREIEIEDDTERRDMQQPERNGLMGR
jgi:peptidoglycan hydrolase-like protein with peptidoglycan-binding domain